MAKNNETTTKFKVDITELKKGIQDAQRQIRLANAEFKAASSGMDDWSKSADGISAKLKQLNTTVDAQKKVLGNLEDQYKAVCDEQGETSKGAEELKIKIANQQAAINKTEKEIGKYEKALSEVDEESDDVAKSSDKAADGIKDVSKEAGEGVKNVGSLADGLANIAKKGFTAVATAAAGAVTGFLATAEATREFREAMGKVETAFTTANFSAETGKKTFEDFAAILGDTDQATEAVGNLAKLATSEQDLAKWTEIATGVYGSFGDGLPIEGLTEAANETAKVAQVTGPLADALNWATTDTNAWNEALSSNQSALDAFNKGVGEGMNAEDAFNEALAACNSEQERSQLITATLSSLYGDAAKTYEETSGDIMDANRAQAELNATMAEVGETAEPIMTTIKQGFADVLQAALALVQDVDFSQVSTKIQEGFAYFIDEVLPKIKDGFLWIKDHSTEIVAAIAGIGAAFVALKVVGIIQSIVTATKAWIAATEGMTVAQKALNLAQKANVIGIVIGLIAALVAAFVVLWNKSEAFREFWINLWDKIKETASKVVDAIGKFFSNLWDGIKKVWSAVTGWFSNLFSGIGNAASNLTNSVKQFFSNAWNGIKNVWSAVGGFFSNIWSGIKNTFSAVGSWFSNIFSTASNGIKKAFSGITGFFSNIWTSIKNTFSKVGEVVGNAITNTVKKAVNGVLSTAIKIINGFISAINLAIGVINKIPGVNISKLDKLEVPQMYAGGVLKKGQVGLLEGNGAEAVVPLDRNKKWIAKTAQDMSAALRRENVIAGNNNTANNYTFNQYNNSPKALSRLEIYRQTKNQLQFAKGV